MGKWNPVGGAGWMVGGEGGVIVVLRGREVDGNGEIVIRMNARSMEWSFRA
jgi:hypothetical protein